MGYDKLVNREDFPADAATDDFFDLILDNGTSSLKERRAELMKLRRHYRRGAKKCFSDELYRKNVAVLIYLETELAKVNLAIDFPIARRIMEGRA